MPICVKCSLSFRQKALSSRTANKTLYVSTAQIHRPRSQVRFDEGDTNPTFSVVVNSYLCACVSLCICRQLCSICACVSLNVHRQLYLRACISVSLWMLFPLVLVSSPLLFLVFSDSVVSASVCVCVFFFYKIEIKIPHKNDYVKGTWSFLLFVIVECLVSN